MARKYKNYISYRAEVDKALKKGYVENLTKAINIWHRSLIITLSGTRTGRIYKLPGSVVEYRASAPGEPPAPRTGTLRASYRTEVSQSALESFLGSELDYSIHMERGTKTIKPRPALEPAFMDVKDQIEEALGSTIEEDTSGGK